jgi:hypothetical protein
VAAAEILRLVEENELLRRTNVDISNKLENSVTNTEEMTRVNNITMHMVLTNKYFLIMILTLYYLNIKLYVICLLTLPAAPCLFF